MDTLQIFRNYQELFSKYYIENNILDSEVTTEQEIEILEDLEPDEVLDNLKDLLHNLIEFKRTIKSSEKGDFINTIKDYQAISNDLRERLDSVQIENKSLKNEFELLKDKNKELEAEIINLNIIISEKNEIINKSIREKSQAKSFKEFADQIQRPNPILNCKEPHKSPESKFVTVKPTVSPHKRIKSYSSLLKTDNTSKSKQTIKSVKFEYFIGNAKSVNKIIKASLTAQANFVSNKTHHSKSNSDISNTNRIKPKN